MVHPHLKMAKGPIAWLDVLVSTVKGLSEGVQTVRAIN